MNNKHFFPISLQMLKLFPRFFFIFIVLLATVAQADIVDRIVAVVNDDVITLTELEEQGKTYFQEIKEETPPESHELAMQRARMEVREGLIERLLVAQKAQSMNISVSSSEVDNTYDMMISKSGLSEETFLEKLAETGHSEKSYKANLANQILQSRLVTQDVRSRIVITEKMLQDHYNEKYMQDGMPSGYHLLQMGFSWLNTGENLNSSPKLIENKIEAEKRAQRVLELAKSGQDFKMVAKKFSELPTAAEGGDIGIFEVDDMANFMRKAIVGLKPGEISPIIETPSGYQFFKLLSLVDGNANSYETVKEDIREKLYDIKLNEEFDKWVKEMKENAVIKRF